MAHEVEVEIERNFAVFKDMIESLLPAQAGKYALLHNQEIVNFFDSAGDAERAGYAQFRESPYSIQLVSRKPVDLGFYSYALAQG